MNTAHETFEDLRSADIAVIGGGISGLAAAHRLHELAPQLRIHLFESQHEWGGVLGTDREGGYLIERSADMFTTLQPWAWELCRRIEFDDQLIRPQMENRRAFVMKRKRFLPVPDGLSLLGPSRVWPLITTPLLPWTGKLRMLGEMLVKTKPEPGDESLAEFTRRRLGHAAFDWLIQPLVGGIYTADPEKLSMQATMPQFLEMEQRHGSLFRGMRANRQQRSTNRAASGARYDTFCTPREGMSALVATLVGRLPADHLHLGCSVRQICRIDATNADKSFTPGGWRIQTSAEEVFDVSTVIVATPAPATARLLQPIDPPLADQLQTISLASAAIAVYGVKREQIGRPVDGFGFVVPQRESSTILAGSFSSTKFAGRAPEDRVLMRIFVGGALQPELLAHNDQQLHELVWGELRELLQIQGQPELQRVVRWENTMPQYHVGHVQRVDQIEERVGRIPGLELAGNAYRGVGIPFCVHSGEAAAERTLRFLSSG